MNYLTCLGLSTLLIIVGGILFYLFLRFYNWVLDNFGELPAIIILILLLIILGAHQIYKVTR